MSVFGSFFNKNMHVFLENTLKTLETTTKMLVLTLVQMKICAFFQ